MNFLSTTPNFRKSEICQMAKTLGGAPFVKQNFCRWMCIRRTSKGSLLLLGTLVTCTLNWSSATNENKIYVLCMKDFLSKLTLHIHCVDCKALSNTHIDLESERKRDFGADEWTCSSQKLLKTFLSYNRIFVEFIELMKTAASFYTQRTLCANMMHWIVYRSWRPIKTIWTFLYQSNEGCFQFMKSNLAVYFLK